MYDDDDVGYHGTDGPLVVSDVMVTSLSEAFVVAGAELGYQFTDVNARSQQGTFTILTLANCYVRRDADIYLSLSLLILSEYLDRIISFKLSWCKLLVDCVLYCILL